MPLLAVVGSSVFEKIESLYLRVERQWTSIKDLHPQNHPQVAVEA